MAIHNRLVASHSRISPNLFQAFLCAALLVGWGSGAQAALIHDIFLCDDVAGGSCDTPVGHIEFSSESGSQTGGEGIEFGYILFGEVAFDAGDIQTITWAVDPDDWLIFDFDMRLDTDPGCFTGESGFPCNQTSLHFSVIEPGLMATDGSAGFCSEDDSGGVQCSSGTFIGAANAFVPQHDDNTVPEPASLLLLSIGLLGLVSIHRSRSA